MPERIQEFFGAIPEEKRPFQVAIGGGEPTGHPEFVEILKTFNKLGIVPNYTTNGKIQNRLHIFKATKENCGGIAVTAHSHMGSWATAVHTASDMGIYVDLHVLISNLESVKRFQRIYETIPDMVSKFVLLPIVNQGRAIFEKVNYGGLFKYLDTIDDISKIAFGSQAYSELIKRGGRYARNLYDPEMFSKYVDLTKSKPNISNSSFERN
jgi:hypothetical protein